MKIFIFFQIFPWKCSHNMVYILFPNHILFFADSEFHWIWNCPVLVLKQEFDNNLLNFIHEGDDLACGWR